MTIDIAKEDLQGIRELLWEGRSHYGRSKTHCGRRKMVALGTKMIKKINACLKKVHGHDCNGGNYI